MARNLNFWMSLFIQEYALIWWELRPYVTCFKEGKHDLPLKIIIITYKFNSVDHPVTISIWHLQWTNMFKKQSSQTVSLNYAFTDKMHHAPKTPYPIYIYIYSFHNIKNILRVQNSLVGTAFRKKLTIVGNSVIYIISNYFTFVQNEELLTFATITWQWIMASEIYV